jgi:hypothetical protein
LGNSGETFIIVVLPPTSNLPLFFMLKKWGEEKEASVIIF